MLNRIVILCMLTIVSQSLFAQKQEPIKLYPDGVPNSKKAPAAYAETRVENSVSLVTDPTITPYFPDKDKANGTAILIFPGGSYINLAMGHEGDAIAKEFNKIGVTAFVIKYRLPSDDIMVDKTIGPLQDAERAMQIVRKRAVEWGVNPSKVGIIGFSAGGHLASTFDTHFDKVVIDNKDKINLRPDFAMLIYPVVSFGPFAHAYSRENLVGKNPSAETLELYSNEKQVTANTPPTFLIHAEDDDVVPVQNSLLFYDALVKNKVKSEMHIFQAGGHGFGLNNPKSKDKWFDWAANWLNENGF